MWNMLSGTELCRVSFAVYEQMTGAFSSTSEESDEVNIGKDSCLSLYKNTRHFSHLVKYITHSANKLEIYLMISKCCFVLEAT